MMKMRTRKPAASADSGRAIHSETAIHRYIMTQAAKNRQTMSRAEPDSAPIPATGMGCFPREAGQFLTLLHPPSTEMNPPSRIVPHRHDASAAGTNELPAVTQRSVLEQNKIVLRDLLVHIANHATTKCTPRADDLFARACDHHV